jgi:lipoprotein signal peptidase
MTLFFISINVNPLSFIALVTVLATSTILGGVLSLVYVYTHKKTVYDQSFSFTLLLLPLVISIIVLLISDNLARAFSLAGVFTLVRFRTAIADSRDITYILSTVGIALSSAMGLVGIALIITAFISTVLILLNLFKMDKESTAHAKLRIVIPESLNYTNAFDDVFKKFVISYQLQKVKTTDFGTMFELTYLIKVKPSIDQKAFLDELRMRNGNLSITLTSDYVSLVSEL